MKDAGNDHVPFPGTVHSLPDCTVKEWLTKWLQEFRWAAKKLKESTYANYYLLEINHIFPQLGQYRLSELTPWVLRGYFNLLLTSGRMDGGGGLSPATVRGIYHLLNLALSDAEKLGLMECNPCGSIDLERYAEPEMRVLTRAEQAVLEQELEREGLNSRSIGVWICLYMGLRIGEVVAIDWSTDYDGAALTVRKTKQRISAVADGKAGQTKLIEDLPKSHSSARRLPMPEVIRRKLERLRGDLGGPLGKIVCREDGSTYEPRTYRRYFVGLLHRAGIQHTNFHALRHTFATRALEEGMDLKTLSELLGHSSTKMTEKYTHSLDEHKRDAIRLLDQLWETPEPRNALGLVACLLDRLGLESQPGICLRQ